MLQHGTLGLVAVDSHFTLLKEACDELTFG